MKARTENLSEHVSALALTVDAELSINQRIDKFFKFVDVSFGVLESSSGFQLHKYHGAIVGHETVWW